MQIKCKQCGTMIDLDENEIDKLKAQVRTEEFQKEVNERVALVEKEKKTAISEAIAKEKAEQTKQLSKLQSIIDERDLTIKSFEEKAAAQLKIELSKKDIQIANLNNQLETDRTNSKLEIQAAVQQLKEENMSLKNDLELTKKDKQLSESNLIKSYEAQLKRKDELIEEEKNFKKTLSTKMIGESLETFCRNDYEINRDRFPYADFVKDNKTVDGTKGDFTLRAVTPDGVDFLSIEFEMKNESEETKKKQTNEQFLSKLDSDRKKKNCEYAVLVTTLEEDNELYNRGIVNLSHKYPKMYAIRPQFFIPLIQILYDGALKNIEQLRQVKEMREQEIDFTHFKDNMNTFKDGFVRVIQFAKNNHDEAIKSIDKIIKELEGVKKVLATSNNQLDTSNNKLLNDFTIERLTKDAPSVKKQLEEL